MTSHIILSGTNLARKEPYFRWFSYSYTIKLVTTYLSLKDKFLQGLNFGFTAFLSLKNHEWILYKYMPHGLIMIKVKNH